MKIALDVHPFLCSLTPSPRFGIELNGCDLFRSIFNVPPLSTKHIQLFIILVFIHKILRCDYIFLLNNDDGMA